MCLSKTKLNKDIDLSGLGLRDYNIWRRDRGEKAGGGVILITHNTLKVNIIDLENTKAEILAVEVLEGNNKTDVAVAYMPPNTRA